MIEEYNAWLALVKAEILEHIPEEHCKDAFKDLDDALYQKEFAKGGDPKQLGQCIADGIDWWLNEGQYL